MNVKRFTARTAREALVQVRETLGEDAVVLSTKPSGEGVEVLAMLPEGLARLAQAAARAAPYNPLPPEPPRGAPPLQLQAAPATARPMSLAERIAARGDRPEPRAERVDPRMDPMLLPEEAAATGVHGSRSTTLAGPSFGSAPGPAPGLALGSALDSAVARDVETLGMSTLTFQDYVRERMLKRRQAELAQPPAQTLPQRLAGQAAAAAQVLAAGTLPAQVATPASNTMPASAPLRVVPRAERRAEPAVPERHAALRDRIHANAGTGPRREPPVLRDEVRLPGPGRHDLLGRAAPPRLADSETRHDDGQLQALRGELQSVRSLIDERFGMLAFMERLQRDPRQAALSQTLFDTGLSPALVRKLVQSLPADAPDALAWAADVLQRNLHTDEAEAPLEDHEGVLALIGPTGVGKTTSTAKLAAAFATRHGAANLGLITLDAYRVAAHEQLRTYGRILGVPVHTAHDRASLEDLLELLSAKKLVLIDTAGMAQRDARTRELLEMLQHPAIKKLLVINAAAQGETVEDVMVAYGVTRCHGVVVSKLDEAVKLGPALDALIRHRAKVVGVANGQRVPEDWHRLTAQALVQRALRGGGNAAWKLDAGDVNLVFAAIHGAGWPQPAAAGQALPQPV